MKFYMATNFDFTKPVTENVLKCFLEASGKICEEQNPGIEFEGEYITKNEYETGSADDSKLIVMAPVLEISKSFMKHYGHEDIIPLYIERNFFCDFFYFAY
mgnify:CR=1 FL=1